MSSSLISTLLKASNQTLFLSIVVISSITLIAVLNLHYYGNVNGNLGTLSSNQNYQTLTVTNIGHNHSDITLYIYNSNFTDLYQSIYHRCHHTSKPPRFFQHLPDYFFFEQLSKLNVNVVSSINQLQLNTDDKIIFVVPIWNDILASLVDRYHWIIARPRELRHCYKKQMNISGYRHRNDLINDIIDELTMKISEFERYTFMRTPAPQYITIFHGWHYRFLWRPFVKPIYVKHNMSIIHYERNAFESSLGKAKLYGYKRIVVAPYLTSSYLLPSDHGNDTTIASKRIMNEVYFNGGIRENMLGAMVRIAACKLNQIKGVNVEYVNTMKHHHNLTGEELEYAKQCIQNHTVKKHGTIYNNKVYLDMMRQMKASRHCWFLRGDTYSSRRFYDAIEAECVPIIVSDEWLTNAAPFNSIIDYRKMCYFITEDAFKRDPIHQVSNILQSQTLTDFKLKYMKQNKHHLIWSNNHSTVTRNIFLSLIGIDL